METFEFLIGQAMALDIDVERYGFEMLREFLNNKNIRWISGENGYSRGICTKFLVETAGNLKKDRISYYRLDARNIRHDKDELLNGLTSLTS